MHLAAMIMNSNFYSPLSAETYRAASPLLRLALYQNREKVLNLKAPIRISFPINYNTPQLSYIVEDVFTRATRSKAEVMESSELKCMTYD